MKGVRLHGSISRVSRGCCVSLLPQWKGDIGIIAKEDSSQQTKNPSSDFGVVSFLNKDNYRGDQIEDGCYEGSEEITPRPVDELYLVVQLTHVDDEEDSSKDHLNHRQGGISWCGGTEANQNHQAKNNLSKKENSLAGEPKVGAGSPAARSRETFRIRHGVLREFLGVPRSCWPASGFEDSLQLAELPAVCPVLR